MDTLQEADAKVIQGVWSLSNQHQKVYQALLLLQAYTCQETHPWFHFKDPAEETQPVLSPEQQIKAELDAYEANPKVDPEEDRGGSATLVESAESQVSMEVCVNLHSHIHQSVQQALHQSVCSAPQATLSPPKELLSS